MSMKHWWNGPDREELKYSGDKLLSMVKCPTTNQNILRINLIRILVLYDKAKSYRRVSIFRRNTFLPCSGS